MLLADNVYFSHARRAIGFAVLISGCLAGSLIRGEERPPAPPEPIDSRRLQGRSGYFERLASRAERTPEERTQRVVELRAAYAKPAAEWPVPHVDASVEWHELGLIPRTERAPRPPQKEGKPQVDPRLKLGRWLFFDPRLSRTGEMACASCHDPDLGWSDGKAVSFGLHRTPLKRNAPSVMNTALLGSLFWDGRAGSLEDQAQQVLQNPQEMGSSEALLKERLSAEPEYVTTFEEVFGDGEVTLERVSQALAAFERTLVGGRSRFDAFLKGNSAALSDSALLGLDLFRRDARCLNCHHGPLLTDGKFHDVGLSYYGRRYEDRGRFSTTGAAEDVGRFRTPSLRNVTATRPYMHNGLFELEGVLSMYNVGMPTLTPKKSQAGDPLFPKKSPLLKSLGLNRQDLTDLEAFLKSLEEPRARIRPPRLPGQPAEPAGDAAPATTADETES